MTSPRMTVTDILTDMRGRGLKISQKTFRDGVDAGCFPFVKVLGESEATGRRNLLILRRDYESWADEYLEKKENNQ